MAQEERVVINIDVDYTGDPEIARAIASVESLERRIGRLNQEYRRKNVLLERQQRLMQGDTRGVNQSRRAYYRLQRTLGTVGQAFKGLFSFIAKFNFIGMAADIGLVSVALLGVKAALVTSRFAVQAWSVTMQGLGAAAGAAAGAIATVAASLNEFQQVSLAPLLGGMTNAASAVRGVMGDSLLSFFGVEGLTGAVQELSRASDLAAQSFPRILRSLGNFTSDPKQLASLAAAFAAINTEGRVTAETFSTLQGANPVFAQAFAEISSGQVLGLREAGPLAQAAVEAGKITAEEFDRVLSGELESTNPWEGQLERLNDTLFGQVKGLIVRLADQFTDFGMVFLVPFKNAIGQIENIFQVTLIRLRRSVSRFGVESFIPGLVGTLEKTADFIVRMSDEALPKLEGFASKFSKMWEGVRDFFNNVGAVLKPLEEGADIMFKLWGPFFTNLLGSRGLGLLIMESAEGFEQNAENVERLGKALGDFAFEFMGLFRDIQDSFFAGSGEIAEFFDVLANNVMPVVREMFAVFRDMMREALPTINALLKDTALILMPILEAVRSILTIPKVGPAIAMALIAGRYGGVGGAGLGGGAALGSMIGGPSGAMLGGLGGAALGLGIQGSMRRAAMRNAGMAVGPSLYSRLGASRMFPAMTGIAGLGAGASSVIPIVGGATAIAAGGFGLGRYASYEKGGYERGATALSFGGGALGGAGIGFMVAGPVGAAVGAALGGIIGGISAYLGGQQYDEAKEKARGSIEEYVEVLGQELERQLSKGTNRAGIEQARQELDFYQEAEVRRLMEEGIHAQDAWNTVTEETVGLYETLDDRLGNINTQTDMFNEVFGITATELENMADVAAVDLSDGLKTAYEDAVNLGLLLKSGDVFDAQMEFSNKYIVDSLFGPDSALGKAAAANELVSLIEDRRGIEANLRSAQEAGDQFGIEQYTRQALENFLAEVQLTTDAQGVGLLIHAQDWIRQITDPNNENFIPGFSQGMGGAIQADIDQQLSMLYSGTSPLYDQLKAQTSFMQNYLERTGGTDEEIAAFDFKRMFEEDLLPQIEADTGMADTIIANQTEIVARMNEALPIAESGEQFKDMVFQAGDYFSPTVFEAANSMGSRIDTAGANFRNAVNLGTLIFLAAVATASSNIRQAGYDARATADDRPTTGIPSRGGDTATTRIGRALGFHNTIANMGNFSVTSGLRNHNLGSPSSDHANGYAYDIVGDRLGAYSAAVNSAGGFSEMHGSGGSRHLHVVPPIGDTASSRASAGRGSGAPVMVNAQVTIKDSTNPQATARAVEQILMRKARDAAERS